MLALMPAARGAILEGTAYGLTNVAGQDQVMPDVNPGPSFNTGNILVADDNTGIGAGLSAVDVYGNLSAAAHACGEPRAPGGRESDDAGYGSGSFSDTYIIRSSTLAFGTPVTVNFCALAALRTQNNDALRQSQTTNDASVQFRVSYGSTNDTYTGVYSYVDNQYGARTTNTGTLFAGEQDFSVPLTVGQSFSVYASLVDDATTGVVVGETGDVQAQSALVWGAAADSSAVTITGNSDGYSIPDMTNCNQPYLQTIVPGPLVNLPEPTSAALVVSLCACFGKRRRCEIKPPS